MAKTPSETQLLLLKYMSLTGNTFMVHVYVSLRNKSNTKLSLSTANSLITNGWVEQVSDVYYSISSLGKSLVDGK